MSDKKSTFNYVLNDLALSSLIFRVIDSNEVASEQDKIDLKYQIELLQQENEQLKEHLEKLNQPQVFIDKDIEEQYGYGLENDFLRGQLKQRDEVIDEAIKFLKLSSPAHWNSEEEIKLQLILEKR